MKVFDVQPQRLRKRKPKLADRAFVALCRDLSQIAYLRQYQIDVPPEDIRKHERKTFAKLMRCLTSY
jgi:hypothetical protein